MPRGKYMNNKGRIREFTPADVLQQERDRVRQGERSSKAPVKNQVKVKCEDKCIRSHGAHSLIEISNPNRLPLGKPLSLLISNATENQFFEEDKATQKRRRDRKDMQCENIHSKEVLADLARLALVRKEREAAAQQRLAAKKATAGAASNSDTFLKKISHKSSEDSPPEVQGQSSNPMVYQRNPRARSNMK
ncbi:uncharacterized protein Dere_GG12786 [Drosophila erecta]|uniref:Casein kinase substrate phosphoprotein PP28 domain-containing protein n=1 Tax=Drosophila erecta TaxID=7220 RepID=B3P966_DROER|nr:uncharacterized protein Dere_GG12786 [Drosophila erecta]